MPVAITMTSSYVPACTNTSRLPSRAACSIAYVIDAHAALGVRPQPGASLPPVFATAIPHARSVELPSHGSLGSDPHPTTTNKEQSDFLVDIFSAPY